MRRQDYFGQGEPRVAAAPREGRAAYALDKYV